MAMNDEEQKKTGVKLDLKNKKEIFANFCKHVGPEITKQIVDCLKRINAIAKNDEKLDNNNQGMNDVCACLGMPNPNIPTNNKTTGGSNADKIAREKERIIKYGDGLGQVLDRVEEEQAINLRHLKDLEAQKEMAIDSAPTPKYNKNN